MINFISYLISALFMFLVGNIQDWLKPILIAHDYPEWIYGSFPFYATIFVAAGLLNTYFIQALKPKNADEKELATLRKKCKSNDRTSKKTTQKAVSECTSSHEAEISRIKREYSGQLRLKLDDHKKEIASLLSKIKAKDVLIESMTNQLAEKFQIIEDYNKETSNNQNTPERSTIGERGTSIVPNISEYS